MHSKNFKRFLYCLLMSIIIAGISGCEKKAEKRVALEKLDLKDEKAEAEEKEEVKEKVPAGETKEKRQEEAALLYVYVCGAVNAPGVYEVAAGARLYEAVEAAGGMTEQADTVYLNQAELLADGQRVYVPTIEEAGSLKESGMVKDAPDAEVVSDGKIDLNTASKEELMTLTGIGEAKANSIINYREQQGGFKAIEDIKQIEGIKDGVFNKIKDMIAVR